MPFDAESALAARGRDPKLTPYDTGEMLEPITWMTAHRLLAHREGVAEQPVDEYGKVDYENGDGETELTIYAHPSTIEDDTVTVQIDSGVARYIKVVVNDLVLGIYPTE